MSRMTKGRILVVDDDSTNRQCIADLLTAHGYVASTAEDGKDALSQLIQEVPDVIVSDLNMPKMSGLELLSLVRRGFPGTLLIAMSGAFAHESVPDGVVADAFFPKGQRSLNHLVSTIGELLLSAPGSPSTNGMTL